MSNYNTLAQPTLTYKKNEISRFDRTCMYDMYCMELAKYDETIYRSASEVKSWCNDYLDNTGNNIVWLPITSDILDGQEIGFVIIAKLSEREIKRSGIDYFIEQVYIYPQYRGKKYVSHFHN